MNVVPEGLIYSTDPDLVQRLVAYLSGTCRLNESRNPSAVEGILQSSSEILFLLDLRAPQAREILSEILQNTPSMVIIAFGTPRSALLFSACPPMFQKVASPHYEDRFYARVMHQMSNAVCVARAAGFAGGTAFVSSSRRGCPRGR